MKSDDTILTAHEATQALALRTQARALHAQIAAGVTHTTTLRSTASDKIAEATRIERELTTSAVTMTDEQREDFREDLITQIEQVCRKHGVDVDFSEFSVTARRGIMHLSLRMVSQTYNLLRQSRPYFRERGQTQAEMRFMQFYASIGLLRSDLHDRFEIEGNTYELLGLKGRTHKVILRPVGSVEVVDQVDLPHEDFKRFIGRLPPLAIPSRGGAALSHAA